MKDIKKETNLIVMIGGKPAPELPVSIARDAALAKRAEASALAAGEFRKKAKGVRQHKVAILKRITDVEDELKNKQAHRGAIKAVGKDPEQEIKALESEKRNLEGQLQLVNQEIQTIFAEEQKRITSGIAASWKDNYERVSDPRKLQIETAIAQIKSVLNELRQHGDSSHTAVATQSDAEVDAFNRLTVDFGVGLRIPDANKLGTIIVNDNKADADKITKEIPRIAEEFRKDMEAAWRKKNPEQARMIMK